MATGRWRWRFVELGACVSHLALMAMTWVLDSAHEPIPIQLAEDSSGVYYVCMKTTVDIPDGELADAMRFTRATTKREAIVTAITEFNRRRRMAELTKRAGTCPGLVTVEELQRSRRRE